MTKPSASHGSRAHRVQRKHAEGKDATCLQCVAWICIEILVAMAGSMVSICKLGLGSGVGASFQGCAVFQEFNGLAAFKPFSPASSEAIRLRVTSRPPLRIEAREPTKKESTKVRQRRLRKKLNGTSWRPRLVVFRSNQHLYAQVIDDTKHRTLAHVSTLSKTIREELEFSADTTVNDVAKKAGETIAKDCLEKGISKVSLDRSGLFCRGRVKAFMDGIRQVGLDFQTCD